MRTLVLWVSLMAIVSTVCATAFHGMAGFLAAAILWLALFPVATMWAACRADPFSASAGLGTAIAMLVGLFVVLGLCEIIFGGGMSFKVMLTGPYSPDWSAAQKYPELVDQTRMGVFMWLLTGAGLCWGTAVAVGSLLLALVLSAKSES